MIVKVEEVVRAKSRSKAPTRVSFVDDDLKPSEKLTRDQQELMTSIGDMLASEGDFNDGQKRVLDLVRAVVLTKDAKIQTEEPLEPEEAKQMRKRTLTLYTLASHLTHECIKLSVEPSSVLQTFASLQRRKLSLPPTVPPSQSATRPPTQQPAARMPSVSEGETLAEEEKKISFMLAETPAIPEDLLRRVTVADADDEKEVRGLIRSNCCHQKCCLQTI